MHLRRGEIVRNANLTTPKRGAAATPGLVQDRSGFPSTEEAARPTARNEAQNSVKRNEALPIHLDWLSETERDYC
jgi:hypothetical protein